MIVVSIATIRSRTRNIPQILRCLENQTLPPDKVIIHFSTDPWHLDQGFVDPPKFWSSLDLEIVEVPNIGSCRKYIFTATRYYDTDTNIVLLDDDLVWRNDLLETLCRYRELGVVSTRGWSDYTVVSHDGVPMFHRGAPVEGWHLTEPTEILVPSSGWATMFHVRDVDDRLFDTALHEQYGVCFSDEVFLAAMLSAPKFALPFAPGLFKRLPGTVHLHNTPMTRIVKAKQIELLESIARQRWSA